MEQSGILKSELEGDGDSAYISAFFDGDSAGAVIHASRDGERYSASVEFSAVNNPRVYVALKALHAAIIETRKERAKG